MSVGDTESGCAPAKRVIGTTIRLPRRFAGTMLTAFPLRRTTRLLAHIRVAPSASKSPNSKPLRRLPENISKIPPKQIVIASQVRRAILSRRKSQLRRLLNRGVAASIIRAFAAAVCLSALTKKKDPVVTIPAEKSPIRPMLRKLCRNWRR